jgi:fatty acid desaturase
MAATLFASRHGSDLNLPQVQWRDLIAMNRSEKLLELLHPLPWLVASLWLYSRGQLVLGALASFYFFLTGLRLSHGAQHYSIGLPRRAQDLVLFTLSALMLGSMHAVQASHLHHHRHCLTESDAEGATARLSWWRALLVGPLFPIRLHRAAWTLGTDRQRRWILVELIAIACVIITAFLLALPGLTIHVAAMLVGECFTGFFAVWTVHHHCDDAELPARTQRGRWINRVSYNMFFHAEHHLYPAVPTCHLHTLADRLDHVNSTLARKQVLGRDQPLKIAISLERVN